MKTYPLKKQAKKFISSLFILAALFMINTTVQAQSQAVKNVLLVHGAFADGSGWKGVYTQLTQKGYNVSIAQLPLTSLKDDVAAAKRVLDRINGPAVLVGHSWGGTVITELGADPKVKALVYIAAFIPDKGETAGQWAGILPPAPENGILAPDKNGYLFYDQAKFHEGFAADLTKAESDFMAASQVPVLAASFGEAITNAPWHTKPSYAILTTEDKSLLPEIQRKMYNRANSIVKEIKASHVVFISQPKAVADFIIRASSLK